jgi:uncharacterized protein YdhG (YjbR/CyaY superfamily)
MKAYPNIAAYIKAQPKEVQEKLREIYAVIKAAAPIKYGMPTFEGKQNLVHFAGMKGHLGFYPSPSPITHFATELETFSTSKGCIRLPYDAPLPKSLITKIVKFRVAEDRKIK